MTNEVCMEGHIIYLEMLNKGQVGSPDRTGGPPMATPKMRKGKHPNAPKAWKLLPKHDFGSYSVVHKGTKEF